MLWEVDVYPMPGQPDLLGHSASAAAAELGLGAGLRVSAARGYLIQADWDRAQAERVARELLVDSVVERAVVAPVGDEELTHRHGEGETRRGGDAEIHGSLHRPLSPSPALLFHVLPKPGVMDPVAQSVMSAIEGFGLKAEVVRTLKKYWIEGLPSDCVGTLAGKVLANDAIEQVVVGPLTFRRLDLGSPYRFCLITVPIRAMDEAALQVLSRQGQLYLSLVEMQTIQAHFRQLGRDPTDAELETIAQTWSEHCSHKTLTGRIRYREISGDAGTAQACPGLRERVFQNMLKETIFAATQKIRQELGADDWCVSVFRDNAGIVRFDDEYNVVFKVETHNHPSALEPYGGANTGIGGVIRDPMGTGMGAKPICNTDVFCFTPPDTPAEEIPAGVLHPRRVIKGVVSGVRDYGNRMGIPTVNGAVYFDPRYLGNPLVFCGNVGLIPRGKSFKETRPGDVVVAIGGRTGRDGIHGATFSSAELHSESETVSGGAVQIGNAITEKMVLDVLLAARDREMYTAVTDCGAGGFSSAVGEMGEHIGAEVWLDRVPLKYEGLSYTEIWISEAQERMVLSVPPEKVDELVALCCSEGVEATVIGQFVPTGRLVLKYHGQQVADLSMEFLHGGRPAVVREAVWERVVGWDQGASATAGPPVQSVLSTRSVVWADHRESHQPIADEDAGGTRRTRPTLQDFTPALLRILGSLNVCSKEWIIRQYDHEVQAGSVIKPLVGAANDGPSDAAVLRPVLKSRRGIVIACGMNPYYGDLDPYWMAAAAIDEAVRNCVAVGADPSRIAILDNFCWGNCDRPETLGSLVRAALACYDVATALGTPFISGKDSLNNEFRPQGAAEPIAIPPSLLISAIGQVDDVSCCVTMDLKESGNLLYIVGMTRAELGGSHYEKSEVRSRKAEVIGQVPQLDPQVAKRTFAAVHHAIHAGLVRACHDLSEGGLAVAAAEMAFAGGFGADIGVDAIPCDGDLDITARLFSESNTRFLCEVRADNAGAFEAALAGTACARVGRVTEDAELVIRSGDTAVVKRELAVLKEAWQKPLRW
jgi:phosphoribosylformylglycinamidine (FGAM) synthase-like enzyme/phosphoribosylformylglycinamidine (FGAM) synthase PurS component